MNRPPSRRTLLTGAMLTGVAAGLSACTDASTPEQRTAPATTAPPLPDVGWHSVDRADVPEGGTLRLRVPRLPENWNPHHIDGAVAELDLLRGPLGGGAELTAQGTGPDPLHIERAQVTASQPMTVSFRYNPSAVWEDGNPIVVEDLIARWRACNGEDPRYEAASTAGWSQIHSIERTDDEFTGRIVFTSPFADWMAVIHPDVPAAVTSTPQAFTEAHRATPTPSRGPFRIDAVDEAAGTVTMVRNERWWGPPPRLERIEVSVLGSEDAAGALAAGGLHALEVTTAEVLGQVDGRDGVEIRRVSGTSWTHLTLTVAGPQQHLADPLVREAIARGLDRESLARAALEPLGAPVTVLDSVVHLPGQPGYEDSFAGLSFDPEAAAALLDEAGWALDDGRRQREGRPLTLSLVVPADAPALAARAALIQEQVSQLGIEVELREVPAASFFSEHLAGGDFDLTTFAWTATRFPGLSSAGIAYPLESPQNYTGMADERIGPVVEQMTAALDSQERTRLANELSSIIAQTFTVIPLFVMPQVWAVREGVVNLGPSSVQRVDWTAVGLRA